MDIYQGATAFADRIEQELKRIGAWRDDPPPDAAFDSQRAFFADTMSLYQWLEFVLLARVREIIAERGSFPTDSQVGAYAVRELDGQDEACHLVSLLCEFDAYMVKAGRKSRRTRRASVQMPRDEGPPSDQVTVAQVPKVPLPMTPPEPAIGPIEVVENWWRTRDAALLHPAPRSRAGFDTTLVDRVFESATEFRQVLGEAVDNADGLELRTQVSGWRGDWIVLTVLRDDAGQWRVDLPLSVAYTARMLLGMRRNGGPGAQDDSTCGIAMRYWSHVQNGNARLAQELQLEPEADPPRMAIGFEDYAWFVRQVETPDGVDVCVLVNAEDGCCMLHTAMTLHDGRWRVGLIK